MSSARAAAHASAVVTLESYAPADDTQAELRRRYLDHLEQHPDGLLRTCRPDHLTASVLVLSASGEEVLLTLHAKARRWFQLGGHVDPDDATLVAAADRELAEESGIAGVRVDPAPVQLDAHRVDFCGADPAVHLDVRFVAVAPPGAVAQRSDESLAVAWWPVGELPEDEASLTALVAAARERVRRGPTPAG